MDVRTLSELSLRIIFGTLGLAVFGIIFGLVYKGIDRKLSAHFEHSVAITESGPEVLSNCSS